MDAIKQSHYFKNLEEATKRKANKTIRSRNLSKLIADSFQTPTDFNTQNRISLISRTA